jgi:hypothetical protein
MIHVPLADDPGRTYSRPELFPEQHSSHFISLFFSKINHFTCFDWMDESIKVNDRLLQFEGPDPFLPPGMFLSFEVKEMTHQID